MNDSTLHNSYKCYDSIPTPSPTALNNANFMHQSFASNANNNNNNSSSPANLLRTASLDSLINSSAEEQEDSSNNSVADDDDDDDVLSDSDSLTELKNICDNNKSNNRNSENNVNNQDKENYCDDQPRKSDIEEITNGIEPPKEPVVIKAYLEKCHKKCEYKNCCFRKQQLPQSNSNNSNNNNDNVNSEAKSKNSKSNLSSRRNSIASAVSVSRMETILEEPIEPKVSVKEILARFETLREAAEVKKLIELIFNLKAVKFKLCDTFLIKL